MAYSRWGKYSQWYTLWSKTPESETRFKLPTEELKNKQTFEICDFPSYYITYGEIKKKGFKKILKNVEEFYGKKHKVSVLGKETKIKPMKPTKKQLTELYKYLELFVQDVDEEFGWYNFFVYNWIIPFKWKLQNLFKK